MSQVNARHYGREPHAAQEVLKARGGAKEAHDECLPLLTHVIHVHQVGAAMGLQAFNYPQVGLLVHDRFDFVRSDNERDVHGALARAFRRSFSMSL